MSSAEPAPMSNDLARVVRQASQILSGGSSATVIEFASLDSRSALAALYMLPGAEGRLFCDTEARLVGIGSLVTEKTGVSFFIEEHRQSPEVISHRHVLGGCRRFLLNHYGLWGRRGVERFYSSDRLAPYVTTLLTDTLLRPHIEAIDPLHPSQYDASPALRSLARFTPAAFTYPVLISAARYALQGSGKSRRQPRPLQRVFVEEDAVGGVTMQHRICLL